MKIAERSGSVVHVEATDPSLHGVIVNGTAVVREPGFIGTDFDLNVTPYVKFGQENEIIVIGGASRHTVKDVSLNFYEKRVYP